MVLFLPFVGVPSEVRNLILGFSFVGFICFVWGKHRGEDKVFNRFKNMLSIFEGYSDKNFYDLLDKFNDHEEHINYLHKLKEGPLKKKLWKDYLDKMEALEKINKLKKQP